MRLIPLSAIPNQRFSVVLDDQNVTLSLKQKGDAVYMSVECDQQVVVSGHICNDRVQIPRFKTTKFKGHLLFVDTLGGNHPAYELFGKRYQLIYLSEGETWQG